MSQSPNLQAGQPNPVPRQFRRGHYEDASREEMRHSYAHRSESRPDAILDPDCWFCLHSPAEHLDHDLLIAECPDCTRNAAETPGALAAYARQLEYQRAGLLPTPPQHRS